VTGSHRHLFLSFILEGSFLPFSSPLPFHFFNHHFLYETLIPSRPHISFSLNSFDLITLALVFPYSYICSFLLHPSFQSVRLQLDPG